MHWSLTAVAAATAGQPLDGDSGAAGFSAVATDSRALPAGALFVPVRAERDGHEFIAAAMAAGAGGYLIEAGHPFAARRPAGPAVEVADTGLALLDIGRAARARLTGPVVGITGSVGKTSTKDLAVAALGPRWKVAASEKSFNNELGVPLTLANAPADTEVAVIEMGARGPGHIALLCDIAAPTIGVVTAVAAVHTELFGSIDAVAAGKGELVESLPDSGTAVLNADDDRVAAMAARTHAAVLRYSVQARRGADVVAEHVVVGPDLRARFRLSSPWGSAEVILAVRGAHQAGNAVAAAAVALRCGVGLDDVAAALGRAALSPWRMDLRRAPSGALVLNDAYNANPASVAAALRSLAALPAQRRVAVLGEMAELGEDAPAAHAEVVGLAAQLGIDVLAVGTPAYGGAVVAGAGEAVDALGVLGEGDAVLVKGSRVTGLERVAELLLR
jgi:UDP-N-acetylmuramoyl-tripeptide--D-alanyl-D-alanine ligase